MTKKRIGSRLLQSLLCCEIWRCWIFLSLFGAKQQKAFQMALIRLPEGFLQVVLSMVYLDFCDVHIPAMLYLCSMQVIEPCKLLFRDGLHHTIRK